MNIRKKFSAQFMLVSLFILFIIYTLISGFIFQIKKFNEYKSEISLLNKEISATKKEIEMLKSVENGNIKEDLESIARNRLNLVKPDEIFYIVIGKEGN